MAALSAIAAYDLSDAEDSDEENDHHENSNEGIGAITGLKDESNVTEVEKMDDDMEEPSTDEEEDGIREEEDKSMIVSDEEDNKEEIAAPKPVKLKFKRYSCESATALAQKLQGMTDEEMHLPPEPDGRCPVQLQEKIKRLYEKKIKEGENLNQVIQERKDFRNPSIYDKLILFLGIEERGTNFPKTEFDPSSWRKVPDYEDLARAQREDVAKREREKKTKVEFVTGVKKSGPGSGETVKKTKWDKPADDSKSHQSITSSKSNVQSSKTTIISAVGSIKRSKP